MRILYAINSAKRGGAEKHTFDLALGMISLGHEVFVWCPDGEFVEKYNQIGVKVTIRKISGFDLSPSYIFSLAKFLKINKIDVLHAHELKASSNALLAGVLAKTPVRISHTHTPISEWRVPKIKKLASAKFYAFWVNRFATYEMALTESRKKVKIAEGIKEAKIRVIPNGIDILPFAEVFPKNGETYVFGGVGRLTEEKGWEVLIEGYSKFLRKAGIGATKLVIAGEGYLREKLENMANSLGIGENVDFIGFFEESEKPQVYGKFDTFVFPTLAEGFGLVLIEAMASGLSIIASDLPVLQEVGGSTVFFFETGNASDLAEKMFNVYSKRDKLGNMQNDARLRVKELFSIEKFIGNYEKLYLETLEVNK